MSTTTQAGRTAARWRLPTRLHPALSGFASVPITLFGLILVTFLIGRAMPIDPVISIVGDHAPPDVIARVRTELGLDRPLYVQFGIYLRNLAQGDLGTSVMTSHPVTADIAHFFPATLELATTAIIVAILVGVPLGVHVLLLSTNVFLALRHFSDTGFHAQAKPTGVFLCRE